MTLNVFLLEKKSCRSNVGKLTTVAAYWTIQEQLYLIYRTKPRKYHLGFRVFHPSRVKALNILQLCLLCANQDQSPTTMQASNNYAQFMRKSNISTLILSSARRVHVLRFDCDESCIKAIVLVAQVLVVHE